MWVDTCPPVTPAGPKTSKNLGRLLVERSDPRVQRLVFFFGLFEFGVFLVHHGHEVLIVLVLESGLGFQLDGFFLEMNLQEVRLLLEGLGRGKKLFCADAVSRERLCPVTC